MILGQLEGLADVARRLGTENFIAFAPDGLTSVGGYPGDDEKAAEMFRSLDRAKLIDDFAAGAVWLKSRPENSGRMGIIGALAAEVMAQAIVRAAISAASIKGWPGYRDWPR